jgi:hypothetical protein
MRRREQDCSPADTVREGFLKLLPGHSLFLSVARFFCLDAGKPRNEKGRERLRDLGSGPSELERSIIGNQVFWANIKDRPIEG